MKKLLTLVLIITILSCGCSKKEEITLDGNSVSGPGYTLDFPEDWEEKENLMGCDIIGLMPQEDPSDTFRENVNVVIENLPADMTTKEYVDLNLANMEKLLTAYSLISQEEIDVNGHTFTKLEYKMTMGQLNLHNIVLLTSKGGSGYCITASMLEDTWDRLNLELLNVAKNFRFK